MSDAPDSTNAQSPQGNSRQISAILRGASYAAVAAAAATVAYAGYQAIQQRDSLQQSQNRLIAQIGLTHPLSKRLAAEYGDADANLLADAPIDEEKLLNPEELLVAYYIGDDDDGERVDWEGLRTRLSTATGKTVVCQPYLNTADEVADIKSGKIHIVALHSADTPYLVNNAGFIPFGVLGTSEGASGNRLLIAVAAKSPIRTLADIRGHSLTFTRPDSITGYRAAIAVLSQEAQLLPGGDFRFHFSHGQKRSVRGLLEGEHEVVALSADKVNSMLADGSLDKDAFRVLYESQVIPRLTIGHIYNLRPQLAQAVVRCVLEFENATPGAEPGNDRMRFFTIDYRKEFIFPRKIDDSFDPRFGIVSSQSP